MLNYPELITLGFCPAKNYGWMKAFPRGFRLPLSCPAELYKRLPLQIQIFYDTPVVDGKRALKRQLTC